MLTEETAKSLGYKKQFRHKIQQPSFVSQGPIWNKSKCGSPIPNSILSRKHTYSYAKYGKTFGLETRRYIEYHQGILLYFDGENDQEYKGYCMTENLYMYYLPIGSQMLMHLTNGTECSQFYFNDNLFYKQVSSKLLKDVIQLNFYQKYSLLELLGKGTYSKVYLAKNRQSNEKFAVKIVSKKDKNGSCTKNIVDQQKKILRLLNSEYVCKMQEFFEENDSFIFVLQYLTGQDLMTLYRQKVELSLKNLVALLKKVLEGLAHIHSKNIMHRDLKPQNIMIDEATMIPKLIDFGLSLLYNAKTDKKRFKRCGTMGYMAFQVIHNTVDKKKNYDYKCDMFSFGIIAHMMLLGYNPIKGKNYNQTVQKNEQCNILLQKQLILEKYGQSCYDFLNGLLQKDPTKRLSAQEALNSEFIKQQFKDDKNDNELLKSYFQSPTQEKQDEAHFQQEDQQISIPKFQNFVPKKINLQNRNQINN